MAAMTKGMKMAWECKNQKDCKIWRERQLSDICGSYESEEFDCWEPMLCRECANTITIDGDMMCKTDYDDAISCGDDSVLILPDGAACMEPDSYVEKRRTGGLSDAI